MNRPLVLTGALLAPLVACAALAPFRDDVANTNAALGLVLIVVAVAATGQRPAGIAAALSSALWFDFFLTEPYQRFAIADRDDIETAVLLTIVGLGVTEIALWGRRPPPSPTTSPSRSPTSSTSTPAGSTSPQGGAPIHV